MLTSILQRAAEKCQNQCCEEVLGLLEQAVRLQPGNSELYYRLGVCHSGTCRLHSQVSPDIAIEYFRYALSLAESSASPLPRARILDALGNAYLQSRCLAQSARLQASLECHGTAAEIYRSRRQMEDWAREEYNAGNTCCELPEAQFPQKWREAIVHFERSLQVRRREKDPERYAATMENLGTAWRQLTTGDISANVLKAIRCYHEALRIFRAAAYPAQYAALHNNIGNALLSFPAQDERRAERNARRALRHLNIALRVRNRDERPCDYAATQTNRGYAFLRLAAPEPAVECFSEAYDCFLECGEVDNARMVQQRLLQIRCKRSAGA